jgi:hypothetical protein
MQAIVLSFVLVVILRMNLEKGSKGNNEQQKMHATVGSLTNHTHTQGRGPFKVAVQHTFLVFLAYKAGAYDSVPAPVTKKPDASWRKNADFSSDLLASALSSRRN